MNEWGTSITYIDSKYLPNISGATMKEASPRSKLTCTKNVSNLWMLTRMAP